MLKAFTEDIPTGYPIGFGENVHLKIQGQRMGFALMVLESEEKRRIPGEIRKLDDACPAVRALAMMSERERILYHVTNKVINGPVRIMREIYDGYVNLAARTLRALSAVNIFQHAPYFGQFSIHQGPLSSEVAYIFGLGIDASDKSRI